jgi:hypothetical protein
MLTVSAAAAPKWRPLRACMFAYGLLNLLCVSGAAQPRAIRAAFAAEGLGWVLMSFFCLPAYATVLSNGVDVWKTTMFAVNFYLFAVPAGAPRERRLLAVGAPLSLLMFEHSVYLAKMLQSHGVRPLLPPELALQYAHCLLVYSAAGGMVAPFDAPRALLLAAHAGVFLWALGFVSYGRLTAATFAAGCAGRLLARG